MDHDTSEWTREDFARYEQTQIERELQDRQRQDEVNAKAKAAYSYYVEPVIINGRRVGGQWIRPIKTRHLPYVGD